MSVYMFYVFFIKQGFAYYFKLLVFCCVCYVPNQQILVLTLVSRFAISVTFTLAPDKGL